jgi:hypothetical protein
MRRMYRHKTKMRSKAKMRAKRAKRKKVKKRILRMKRIKYRSQSHHFKIRRVRKSRTTLRKM